MNNLKTNCGDWHLKWSGTIGKLELNPLTNTFIWKGHWQGRHGEMGCKASCEFILYDDHIQIITRSEMDVIPIESELIKAANIILQQQMQPPKRKRVQHVDNKLNLNI